MNLFTSDIASQLIRSNDSYPVDINDAWGWAGYPNKKYAEKILTASFEKDVDYVFEYYALTYAARETIKLTLECFKELAMMAGTHRGRESVAILATNLIARKFNSQDIHQAKDGYINLNQMAKAAGKRIDNWLRLQSTKKLIQEFNSQIPSSDLREKPPVTSSDLRERFPVTSSNLRGESPALITMISGIKGQRGGGGTWAHPDIAIQFAQWCSPAFALQVSRWVREIFECRQAPLLNKQPPLDDFWAGFTLTAMTDLANVDIETARNMSKLALEAQRVNPSLFAAGVFDPIESASHLGQKESGGKIDQEMSQGVVEWLSTLDLAQPIEMSITQLHKQYAAWCHSEKRESLGRRLFGNELRKLGVPSRKSHGLIVCKIAKA